MDLGIRDCSRFALVLLAAQRTHDLSAGARSLVERNNHKNTVLSLIEIESEKLDLNQLLVALVERCKRSVEGFVSQSELFRKDPNTIGVQQESRSEGVDECAPDAENGMNGAACDILSNIDDAGCEPDVGNSVDDEVGEDMSDTGDDSLAQQYYPEGDPSFYGIDEESGAAGLFSDDVEDEEESVSGE